MKPAFLAAVALAGACSLPAAHAAFSGALAPALWTTTITGPTFSSSIDTSTAPASITLHGGNDAAGQGCPDGTLPGFVGGCQISFTIGGNATYSFHWSYASSDISPQYDSFGMLVDGVRTQLVASGGDVLQSGDRSVHANSSFGWYINCTDCTGGASLATISQITAVPEPETTALFGVGLLVLAAKRKALRRNVNA